jgi:hypothetical protein
LAVESLHLQILKNILTKGPQCRNAREQSDLMTMTCDAMEEGGMNEDKKRRQ